MGVVMEPQEVEAWAEWLTEGTWDVPALETREEFRAAALIVVQRIAEAAAKRERERCAKLACRYCAKDIPAVVDSTYDVGWRHTISIEGTQKGSGGYGLPWLKRAGDEMYRYAPCNAAAIRKEAE